jgi:hypothetical protein
MTWRRRRLQLLVALDHPLATWTLIVVSLFVIIQEDLKYCALPPAADVGMESVTLGFLCICVLEIGGCGLEQNWGKRQQPGRRRQRA